MKVTGYALLALAGLLVMYVLASNMLFDAAAVERNGAANAPAHTGTGGYWLALIPAAASAAVGLYLVLTREKGFATTYDMGEQQTPWHA